MNFGTPIKLATHREMADELTNRQDLPCLIVYRTKDGVYHCYDNIDHAVDLPNTLRKLADWLEEK